MNFLEEGNTHCINLRKKRKNFKQSEQATIIGMKAECDEEFAQVAQRLREEHAEEKTTGEVQHAIR